MSSVIAGLGIDGKLVVVGASGEPIEVMSGKARFRVVLVP
jgi:hypothetical protein